MHRIIETDNFPFEHISKIAEKESWRKDINRPIYHLHKWWAKRLGSVFRAIILGCILPEDVDLMSEFYSNHSYNSFTVLDPFMGGGTTIGESLKIGVTSFGKDINPVAAETVRVSLTPFDIKRADEEFEKLKNRIGDELLSKFKTIDSNNNTADVLYFFWVMQGECKSCQSAVDLFSDYILAQDAYPLKKPKIEVICPCCGDIFKAHYKDDAASCPTCGTHFKLREGPAKNSEFTCPHCATKNKIAKKVKPNYRLFAKLVLTADLTKEYLKTTQADIDNYEACSNELATLLETNEILLPDLELENGYNTKQAINYGFRNWKNFYNDRQLLLLGLLYKEINKISDEDIRHLFSMIFSSTLEFNNLFASYKGEGTGAVRHMFSHHVLKPERLPIEPNIWGTNKSSGSFSGIYKNKVSRLIEYRKNPKEVHLNEKHNANYNIENAQIRYWGNEQIQLDGSVNLACGDSSMLTLPDNSIDFVVTDPPFFDNVQYSELADFFYSWLKLYPHGFIINLFNSTRNEKEVQDTNAELFSAKFENVLKECFRVLKEDGLLVFTYHHSKSEGWTSVQNSLRNAGFNVVNSIPVKAEMSVATPKSQAKEPIQLDIILVCSKRTGHETGIDVITATESQVNRLQSQGFKLSRNDLKIILYGRLLMSNMGSISEESIDNLVVEFFERTGIKESKTEEVSVTND